MFFFDDGRAVTSASDLSTASACEFAFLRRLDARLGRIPPLTEADDDLLERTARLGDEHEERMLAHYRELFGDRVVELPRPAMSAAGLGEAAEATRRAFDEAEVVYQATFLDESRAPAPVFVGFADFLVRRGGAWLVQDTKLARHAKVTALLQVAAYAEQLERAGLEVAPTVELLLGDGRVSTHALDDITPVFRLRRSRLDRLIRDRLDAGAPVGWRDDGIARCGRCEVCEAEVRASRDVLLVAGMSLVRRERLAEAGIETIDELAASSGPVEGVSAGALDSMRRQAGLQVRAMASGEGVAPPAEVYRPAALAVLPEPDAGDLFFDFEGDPLYEEGAGGGEEPVWGLDYLFGTLETDGDFRPFWAHDLATERRALLDFLDYVAARRREHPGLHIYHYAAYERTHLAMLAARHGVGEEEVDRLLREHVLVDLYPIVRHAIRVGSRSYSIKKLEPLYMGDDLRESEVTTATASITEYARAVALRAAGEHAEADRIIAEIADYNRYDCLSTLRLRDWLVARAAEHGIPVGGERADEEAETEPVPVEPSPLHDALLARAGDGPREERTADQGAAAMAAAALDYHAREQKSFWWAHFARLVDPIDEWEETRDVLRVREAVVERDWHTETARQRPRRILRLRGRAAPGSRFPPGTTPYAVYAYPGPFRDPRADPGARSARTVAVLDGAEYGAAADEVVVREIAAKGVEPYPELPEALTPAAPPRPGRQPDAIAEWAHTVVAAGEGTAGEETAGDGADGAGGDGWPRDAASDLVRRIPPRTREGGLPAVRDGDRIAAVTEAVRALDRSYLAVQGPPGTGKTYLAAHVIARLVRDHGWRIGVVAQSHAVVENLLGAVVQTAGLDRALVGKAAQMGQGTRNGESADADAAPHTVLAPKSHAAFLAEHEASGCVLGGTAWDFSDADRVPRGALDLLVVDEAGQFSLAATIAAGIAARNLLLLGDPQQLPQVSQGTHPEPVDGSALGWVSAGHDVLPAEYGYFLAETRRMHPDLTAAVSRLSYDGSLVAHPSTACRGLDGVEPGLHPVPVEHAGDSISSPDEAAEVVRIVERMLGRLWRDPADPAGPRPLTGAGLIVVTAYNAHLALVREALDAAGHGGVRVGTVDKFQGQEAVVAIVSLAASSAAEVPRGLEFLIMKNRLNVAVSRAKHAAYLIYSPGLLDHLPGTPERLAELSAFARLVEPRPEGGTAMG